MSDLLNPSLDESHPRQMLHDNLCASVSLNWYSREGSARSLVNYVLGLLNVEAPTLQFAVEGFAQSADGSLLIIASEGAAGTTVTVFPTNDAGLSVANAAMDAEWNTMMAALGSGTWTGFPYGARRATVQRGEALSDILGNDEVFDVINKADVVDLSTTF